jgi:V8-like Glu-specific endopeptidase
MKVRFLLRAAAALPALFVATSGFALSPIPADFENGEEGLHRLGHANFLGASVNLKFYFREQASDCSGVVVSDEGHVLTASHCLDTCRFTEEGLPTGARRCVAQVKDRVLSFEVLKGNSCALPVKQKAEMRKLAGFGVDSLPANCQDGDLTDYAVLKPAQPDDLGPFSCLPIAEKKPAVGEAVFTLGYPGPTQRAQAERPSAKDAPGDQLALSTGSIVDSPYCESRSAATNAVSRFLFGDGERTAQLKVQDVVRTLFRHSLQTTVDVSHGSSGGPLIDGQGRVVGVASVVDPWVHNEKHECRGATFFQPVAELSGLRCEKRRARSEAL